MGTFEEILANEIEQAGLPCPVAEHRFHPERRWRFDLAWPDLLLAVEIEGGTWLPWGGRHNRAAGFAADCEKYNAAALLGWRVLRFTTEMVSNGAALAVIGAALARVAGLTIPDKI